MARTLMLIPVSTGVGLTTISLGLFRAIEQQGIRAAFFKPVNQHHDQARTSATALASIHSTIAPPKPLEINHVEQLLSEGKQDDLLEEIIASYSQCANEVDVVVVHGMISTRAFPYASRLNIEISKALSAEIILVATPGNLAPEQLVDQIEIAARDFGGPEHLRALGCVINKINAPVDERGSIRLDLAENIDPTNSANLINRYQQQKLFHRGHFALLACIPWDIKLLAPRVKDIASFLGTTYINQGNESRRISRVTLVARSVENMLDSLKPGTLVITAGDRKDIILATCMASLNGVEIGALLLTGGSEFPATLQKFCQRAMESGLPILSINSNSFQTALKVQNMSLEVPLDDVQRVESVKNGVANYFNNHWIKSLATDESEKLLTPAAFRYALTEKARKANKTIVLPEGDELRTLQAAILCAHRGIANCILLAEPKNIQRIAEYNDLHLPANIKIFDPNLIRDNYVDKLVALRAHKGMTEILARELLQDNVMIGTLMLANGEVDGLVSGAVHTTAHTIRPALQIIKTTPGSKIVSSIFFMCLPDQVLVYGDCAVNPNPNAEELADIAIQSADSAIAFGILPRVAMISYSTGSSGAGIEVDKVKAATEMVKQRRPDIIIDGPLQYDAALIPEVALDKAPNSPVAGHATVFIFPDLNTGNTTYKAVQRSADVVCIGPMLQGLNKPVNDLSRGALVDDIVYTIALTAIQAIQREGLI
jgi:phosphate acetyltransferase